MRHLPALRLLKLALRLKSTALGLTLDEIAETLGEDRPASRSSAERARRALEAAFPQFEAAEPDGRRKRWRIRAGTLSGLVGVGAGDLAALAAAAALCRREGMVPQAAALTSLAERLQAVQRPPAASRLATDAGALAEADGIAFRPGPRQHLDPAVFAALRDAILAARQVEIRYRGRASERESRQRVSPLGMLWGSRNYLIAYSHNRAVLAVRSFALSNVLAVTPLGRPAHRPEGFTLAGHTGSWFGVFEEPPSNVVWRFSRKAARDAREFEFHPTQTLHDLPDGRLEVRFRAGGLREMAMHLANWGSEVEVVAPARLRRMVGPRAMPAPPSST